VLDVTGFLKYAVQAAAMFETRFNSVERLMAYIQLPQEAPATIDATKCVHLRTTCLWPADQLECPYLRGVHFQEHLRPGNHSSRSPPRPLASSRYLASRRVLTCTVFRFCRPEDNWPMEGRLSYRGVWMRYRPELPPVLKGVTFNIAAGDKIGICGRTGSGKSSLIVSLFRIVEPYKVRTVL